jgi:DNA mismatch endonuclease (patch repair protein)
MVDVLTPQLRSFNMSRIRGRDTKPELLLRRGLHARGFRFRLHRRDLPGRPDLVFPAKRAVIFAHGCFRHGHDCPMCRPSATRTDFRRAKIEKTELEIRMQLRRLRRQHGVYWSCGNVR